MTRSPACFSKVPDHWPTDAKSHDHETVDAKMIQQCELIINEAVPGSFNFQRAFRHPAIGVAQIKRDDAIGVAEFLKRVESMAR